MNSGGEMRNLYDDFGGDKAAADKWAKETGALRIESQEVADKLREMSRAARQVFYGARRKGHPEHVALARAMARSRVK